MTFGSMSYEENPHEIFPIGEYINSDAVLGNYQVEVSYDATRLRYVNGGTSAQEDLDMKAMSRCLHFGKGIMDNSYGMFRDILTYKLEEQGKKLVKIARFYPSSKRCCRCGKVKKELKLSERIYICECGNVMDRDKNAAVNIREEARRMLSA